MDKLKYEIGEMIPSTELKDKINEMVSKIEEQDKKIKDLEDIHKIRVEV